MKKIKFINLCGNLGNDLIRKIYKVAYDLEATEVIVKSAKYNRFARIELSCEDGYIDENYMVEV